MGDNMNDRHDWHIVQQPPPPYAKCAVTGFGDGPFIDFGVRMNAIDPNVLIQVDVAKDVGRFVGMVTQEDHELVVEERDLLANKVADLKGEVEELEKFKASVDFIASKDFTARRKPGRPKQKVGG
jgi:hypothetical protein